MRVQDSSPRPKNIIVVGVPRSGTSLTSAVLARKGYYLAPITQPVYRDGNEGNPFGYFEADDIIERNMAVIRQAGFHQHNIWLSEPIPSETIYTIAEMVPSSEDQAFVAEYDRHSPWLWKDPRFCLTLAYWWKLVNPDTTRVILMERGLDDILRSFRRMGWIGEGEADARELTARIHLHLEATKTAITRWDIPHLRLNFDDYFKDEVLTAQRLSRLCGIDIAPEDLNVRAELNHSSLRGRLSTWARIQLRRRPLCYLRHIRPLVPNTLLTMLFPEKKFSRKGQQR